MLLKEIHTYQRFTLTKAYVNKYFYMKTVEKEIFLKKKLRIRDFFAKNYLIRYVFFFLNKTCV